jgi:hypothetical protein
MAGFFEVDADLVVIAITRKISIQQTREFA